MTYRPPAERLRPFRLNETIPSALAVTICRMELGEKTQEEWERAYDEAMQWRDWQTCEILIDEREHADWYVPEEPDV